MGTKPRRHVGGIVIVNERMWEFEDASVKYIVPDRVFQLVHNSLQAPVVGVAQWLGRWSLAGGLSLTYT